MSNALLPHETLEKQFYIRFATSLPHVTPMELMMALKESIRRAADTGIDAYNCKKHEEVMLVPYALFFAGNNPMQAETSSHGGLTSNYFCRTCYVGGNKEYKASDEGYMSLLKVRVFLKQNNFVDLCTSPVDCVRLRKHGRL